jgi:ribosomal protein S18 acetylase RimI-like enzyme
VKPANEVSIRRAGLDELERIVPLFDAYRRFYKQKSDVAGAREFLRQRLERNESVIFLALDGDVPVGFVQLYPSFDSVALQPIWILYDLYVAAPARRLGAGRQLMERARQHAVETNAKGLILETAVDNLPAQKLYEELGWKRDSAFHRYYLDV